MTDIDSKFTHELESQLETYKLRTKQANTTTTASTSNGHNTTEVIAERSLRSVAGSTGKDLDWSTLTKEEGKKTAASRKRTANIANLPPTLDKTLAEKDMK